MMKFAPAATASRATEARKVSTEMATSIPRSRAALMTGASDLYRGKERCASGLYGGERCASDL